MQLQDITDWMKNLALQYGYLGVFVISLIGATSVFIPIPYTVVIFVLGGLPNFDPLWLAVAAGTGAALGELSGYLIGYGGRRVIGERYQKKMDVLMRLFKRFGPVVIFLFALTPLPDDLLFIPLGVMRYRLLSTFIPALLGKFLSNVIIAYAGRFSVGIIKDIFGVEGEGAATVIGIVLAVVLLIVVLVIMFKVDWEKRAEKYLSDVEKADKSKRAAENQKSDS